MAANAAKNIKEKDIAMNNILFKRLKSLNMLSFSSTALI
jgi:hypothetical protein